MAISSSSSTSFAIIIILLTITLSVSSDSDLTAELHALQSQSPSGVIRLNQNLISQFLSSPKPPRPFNLLIFFDAVQLHNKPELNLRRLRSEFSLLASSFIANNPNQFNSKSKLFFCDVEYTESPTTFDILGVISIPHIRLIPAAAVNLKNDSTQFDSGDSTQVAESMAETIKTQINLSVGPIHRPPFLSKNQIILITVASLIWVPFVVKKLIAGETILHDRRVWLAGAVFVYFFSVSGIMYNVIRKTPLFLTNKTNPSMISFFYKGSGIQLGAEGFAIGSLYTIVGLLVALVTHVVVKVKDVNLQRFVMLTCLFICFWAVKKVVFLDNWKTGYGIHMYWPSSWR
ncbi:probable dolichyl-diphosphooligosaccharide--protein glycosyltransferase subunit 3B [Impatiens glandulifera]|uniref:probable dolichyl-diphosphooligosaccharide--protein glycosyltransferase subunit 3B n=1 Tax=Impatiens glandulifera TaxID=253017 RepID=UPI001FB1310B|nr:probable dolichyl-diphosphooligosaccharide--protein glycosyltransferase subunit 3B [Impatiens glandulifera]